HQEELRVVIALGLAEDKKGMTLPLASSTTGSVVHSGQPLITTNIFAEPDAYPPASSTGLACSMMLAPLQTSAGVVGAAAVIRYRKPGGDAPPPFSLAELHYCTAVAAHIASGMELAQAVQSSREAAQRAAAMVNASPLPMALVDAHGRVLQLNAAGRAVFGVTGPGAPAGTTLQELGLSSSEVAFRDVLSRASFQPPWHGRVVVATDSGNRRICDCTVTVLSGLGSDNVLVALYDGTDELRAPRERAPAGQRRGPHQTRLERAARPRPRPGPAAGRHQPRHQRQARGARAQAGGHPADHAGPRRVGAVYGRGLRARRAEGHPRPDL